MLVPTGCESFRSERNAQAQEDEEGSGDRIRVSVQDRVKSKGQAIMLVSKYECINTKPMLV